MVSYKMPERSPADGPMSVTREGEKIRISAETDGKTESALMTEYNAWRAFGALSVLLGLPLPKAVGKAIKF